MRIEGHVRKVGKWWAVEIPLLLIHTQGKTKKDAYAMAKDAVESLIDTRGFRVEISPGKGETFSIKASDDTLLMAFALRQQRNSRNLSIREVAQRMGSNSPSAYSRYEQGKTRPSIDKFTQLLSAIDEELEPILKISSF